MRKTSLFKKTATFVIRISEIRGKALDPWKNKVLLNSDLELLYISILYYLENSGQQIKIEKIA